MAHRDKNDPEFLDRLGAEIFEFDIGPEDSIRIGGDHRDPTSVQDLIAGMMQEAVDHYQNTLEPVQVEATEYYHGRPFGDEKKGRSQVVSTDIRDATASQIPDLLRIFMGNEDVVEFRPWAEDAVEIARQQTDLVNKIVREDNPGFLIFQNAMKDALVRKVGFFKWYWENYDRVRGYTLRAVTEQALMILMEDEDLEDIDILQTIEGPEGLVYDLTLTRFEEGGKPRYEAVPPEEIVWTPNARTFDDSQIIAHTRMTTVDDAVRITGLSVEEVEEFVGQVDRPGSESLTWARQFHGAENVIADAVATADGELSDTAPFSQREVLLTEAYAMMDLDGDEVAELRLFLCLGPDYEIVNGDGEGEIISEIPLSVITPDPEPHTIAGTCNYDNLRDIQRIKSQVQRAMMNSLAQSVESQTEVVSGQVNMKDVLSPEISGIIRVRRPGMVREVRHTFIGGDTLPVLDYLDDVRADRSGMTKASEGLDPNSLQSSTSEAVAATLDKGQQRIEVIARVFAETGVKALYRGLLNLVIENQDSVETVELRGEFVQVDPRSWKIDGELRINGALGTGSLQDRLSGLQSIATDQMALKEAGVPFVSNVHIRNTRKRMIQLLGYTGVSEFYGEWTQEQEAQMQQAIAEQEPPPDPAMLLVQLEGQKIQLEDRIKQGELAQKAAAALAEDDFKRDKLARDAALKEREIEAEFQVEIEDKKLQQQIAAQRITQIPREGQ